MITHLSSPDFGQLWYNTLMILHDHGEKVSPRGIPIREITNVHLELTNPQNNVLVCPVRNPSYRFMVAEWLWIWFGHNDVESISRYSKVIANFSDDGKTFAGAYGPCITAQWDDTLRLLEQNPDSRQAIIQIYRPPSGRTKDVPCTLSMQFLIRKNRLECIVNMRSSDIWLGLVYDVFNFTMFQNTMAAQLGVALGKFCMNLGSSHLYEQNVSMAAAIIQDGQLGTAYLSTPALTEEPSEFLNDVLCHKDIKADALVDLPRPDIFYGAILLEGTTNHSAYDCMEEINALVPR